MKSALLVFFVMLFSSPLSLFGKEKMRVQLYAQTQEAKSGIVWIYVYLVLQNGDHVAGLCGKNSESCTVESFAPEKRKQHSCLIPAEPPISATCFESEKYLAERKKNDITLYGEKGKVTYHIQGTW